MSSVQSRPSPPHSLHDPWTPRQDADAMTSTGKKRKAEMDEEPVDEVTKPSTAPARFNIKRARLQSNGRPLALSRLLETLEADSLRSMLQKVCTQHPEIAGEVQQNAPRPDVDAALAVLVNYERLFQTSFPFGDDRASDYAFNRVRAHLQSLLDALEDFIPHFLPPTEQQSSRTLAFLDGATTIVHALPDWRSFANNMHKQEAYEHISHAWSLAIHEHSKRAAGLQLKLDNWESKLRNHNDLSQGRLQSPLTELSAVVGWVGDSASGPASVRQELLSGQFGTNVALRIPW